MKAIFRTIISFLFICTFSAVSAQKTNTPDTLLYVDSPSRVVITEDGKGLAVNVKGLSGNDSDSSLIIEYPEDASVSSSQSTLRRTLKRVWYSENNGFTVPDEWDIVMDGVCVGLTNPTGPGGSGLEWSKSLEISWLNCIGASYRLRRGTISVGLGFDWRNYRITSSQARLVRTPDGGLAWGVYPEGAVSRFSRLKTFSLQIPLLYRVRIPSTKLEVKVGPIFDFTTYASLKTEFTAADGMKVKEFTKDIEPRRFSVDFFGSISLSSCVGLYIRYSPMKVMKPENSLNFRPLTIGIGLGI